jgi:hypothetical protein
MYLPDKLLLYNMIFHLLFDFCIQVNVLQKIFMLLFWYQKELRRNIGWCRHFHPHNTVNSHTAIPNTRFSFSLLVFPI